MTTRRGSNLNIGHKRQMTIKIKREVTTWENHDKDEGLITTYSTKRGKSILN